MENFEQATRTANAGDYLVSVGLRHAYYSVKGAEEQRRLLCLTWQGTVYQFTCLPNGISEGPRLFTKLMKPVFAALREKDYSIPSFIDNTLISNSTLAGCLACIQDTINSLRSLRCCINEKKSALFPTEYIEYLGNIIVTNRMKIYLSEHRIEKIAKVARIS